MIDLKKLLTKIIKKLQFTPVLLDGSKYECTQTGTTYEYTSISGMDDYNVIAVYFRVHEVCQLYLFVRGVNVEVSITDAPAAGRFRGSLKVDWENEQIGIRAVNAGSAGTRYELIFFKGVYGIA